MSIKRGNVRWAFDLRSWRCTLNDLELATACIQPEEKLRLAKFHFIDDFKASIIGRLLMRQFIKSCLPELDYNAIHFERDERGKPFFIPTTDIRNKIDFKMDFNVSHHERFAVLAGWFTRNSKENNDRQQQQQQQQHVGVDVMKMEYTGGGKELDEFFRIMDRTFAPNEWTFIKSRTDDANKTAAFMRHWSLKESYVKNIGVGISINLRSIDFQITTDTLCTDQIVRDTAVKFEGKLLDNWLFEESLLDNEHCVSVAVKNPTPDYLKMSQNELRFEIIDFERLMRDANPLLNIDPIYCRKVLAKEVKKTK